MERYFEENKKARDIFCLHAIPIFDYLSHNQIHTARIIATNVNDSLMICFLLFLRMENVSLGFFIEITTSIDIIKKESTKKGKGEFPFIG